MTLAFCAVFVIVLVSIMRRYGDRILHMDDK